MTYRSPRPRRIRRTVATAALMALSLSACSSAGGDGTDDGADDGGRAAELRAGMTVDLSTWNAADAAWGNESLYHRAVYDTLLRTEADGTVTAGLATDWSYDETRTELTLPLREDVTFSDGTAFDAEIAAQNLRRFRDGGSENAAYLAAVESFTAEDEHTLVLELSAPDPALLSRLSQNAGLQASPKTFDEDSPAEPVGTGPYVYDAEASIPGSRYVFTAREDYWDPEAQHYDRITMSPYTDATALLNALRDNQVDFTNTQSTTQIADAEAAGYSVDLHPVNWKGYLLADRDGEVDEPLGDVRVRQAINHALDREALVEALEGGHGEPTTQIFGTETAAYDAELEEAYPHDPEKAQELLAEAGYPDGITLSQPHTSFVPESEYELLEGMLEESGISIEADDVGSDFIGDLLGGRWGSFSFGLNQAQNSWMTYQLAVAPDAAWNMFGTADETVQKLAETMRGGEEAAADDAAHQLNEHLVEEAWFAPAYRVMGVLVTNDETAVTHKTGQAMPNLRDITPAE